MKRISFIVLILIPAIFLHAQNKLTDSLRNALQYEKTDTGKIVAMYNLSLAYQNSSPDSALAFAEEAYFLSKKINFIKGESWSLNEMAFALNSIGNFSKALEYYIKQLNIEEKRGYPDNIASVYLNIALLYESVEDFDKAIEYAKKAHQIIIQNNFETLSLYSLLDMGEIYEKMNLPDTALVYTKQCYAKATAAGSRLIEGNALNNLGNIYLKKNDFQEALYNYKKALPVLMASGDDNNYTESTLGLAKIFEKNNQADSAIFYGKRAFDIAWQKKFLLKALDASAFLARVYGLVNHSDSVLAYQQIMIGLKDSIDNREKINRFKNIAFAEQLRLREVEDEKVQMYNKIKMYALLAAIAAFVLIAFYQYRINRFRKKTNTLLEQQKNELQNALQQLKNAQARLIQSEKMASLGQLTAGIAHEIQNPLNFVNNFSEVNVDLIQEMKEEMQKGNYQEVQALAEDISANGKKIIHHGKRADAIVKNMLQHSHKSSGEKELININALCDEYLKLSYNNARTKNKLFTAHITTNFDQSIEKIPIMRQDIGSVLLNLYSNAFYATAERKLKELENYEPLISVSTKKDKDKILIRICDNGYGINENIADKIFQPFFTTKPTGEGTGLGLSLSYDIMKAYGGEISMNTKPGQGTDFIVSLPFSN